MDVSLKLIELVNENYGIFSDTEKSICSFLLDNQQDLSVMNIMSLLKKVYLQSHQLLDFHKN